MAWGFGLAARTRAACKRAKLTPLTFHALRASYATIASGQGLPLPQLQALLGHADVKTTSIYLRPESARAALDPRACISGKLADGHVLATSAGQTNLAPN